MQTTPSQLALSAKRAARHIQRTRWVLNLQGEVGNYERDLEDLNAELERREKSLATYKWDYDHAVETGNPRVETFKKTYEYELEQFESYKKTYEDRLDAIQKNIEETNKKIEEVESGELKVNRERRNEIAKELIRERVGEDFVSGDFNGE